MHVDNVVSQYLFYKYVKKWNAKKICSTNNVYFSYFAGSTSKHDGLPSFADRSWRPDG